MTVKDLLRQEQGPWLAIGGLDVAFRLSAAATNGAYAVVEYRLEPGRLVPPHTHSREQEVSYVLEGEIGLRIGVDEFSAEQGCFALKPPQIPHTFWNATQYAARLLEVISPAGFETYFRELADLYASGAPPERVLVTDLRDRYGLTGNPEWIAQLKNKHRLTLLGE